MKHFKDNEWADWARGAVNAERQAAMREHLDSGCKKCKQAADLWKGVAMAASQEGSYEPPESAVRIAKSYAADLKPAPKPSLTARIAELIFDSTREPALAGVRSLTAAPRQLMYRAGEYTIDLRIEREPAAMSHLAAGAADRILLVGQILSTAGKSVRNIPVTVLSGVGPLATGTTNNFGEFHLDFDSGLRVQLSVSLQGSTTIFIPLDALESGDSAPVGQQAGRRGGL